MTSMIYTGTKPIAKVKKKPGWRQAQAEHEEWLAKHKPNTKLEAELNRAAQQPLTLKGFSQSPRQTQATRSVQTSPVVPQTIHDPRVLYKNDPEMLERELKARERKFTTAPIYNKGGDVYVTDEMMKDITAGTTRRR